MLTSDFRYDLPQELIAQTPAEPRDSSRLMVCHRDTGTREHRIFRDLPEYLRPGDALVVNRTRTIPARLLGRRPGTGGTVELLLLRRRNLTDWEALVRPGKKLQPGASAKLLTHLHLADGVQALYGFGSDEERDMFRKLIGVTRIGPKLAISVLSVMTPSDVRAAIVTDNLSAFDRVSGMGRKTAQRVILELAGSLRDEIGAPKAAVGAAQVEQDIRTEAVAALTALGYDGLSASRAVAAIAEAGSVEEMITKALRSMAKG